MADVHPIAPKKGYPVLATEVIEAKIRIAIVDWD
jgi:hypothetical protein